VPPCPPRRSTGTGQRRRTAKKSAASSRRTRTRVSFGFRV
jgi:hypothetical protein